MEEAASPVLGEGYREDPFPVLAKLRHEDPVHWVPGFDAWLVTRYEDVRALFVDPRCTPDRRVWDRHVPATPGTWTSKIERQSLFALPPEEHARSRRVVSAGFTPRAVRRMERLVQDIVEEFAAPLRGRTGHLDLLDELTAPIPNTVISRITGIPPFPGNEERFRRLATAIIRRILAFADEETRRAGEAAFDEMAEWVCELAAERRSEPQDDLISDLLHGQQAGEVMTDEEVVTFIAGLVGAGSETTTIGSSMAIRLLLQHPVALEKLRADRSLLDSTIDESLRFAFGSGAGVARYAKESFDFRGRAIEKGQLVLLALGSAHRDETVFDNADEFDITRDNRMALFFGQGPHYCLGANLARQEMRCILDAALDLLPPGSRLAEERLQFTDLAFMRRVENLPVWIPET